MAREAKAAGYTIRLYYVGINTAEEAIKRIDNRVEKGGHDIPDEDVIRRFNERNEALYKILEYVDEAVFSIMTTALGRLRSTATASLCNTARIAPSGLRISSAIWRSIKGKGISHV